jgi:N-methylhydantoinase A
MAFVRELDLRYAGQSFELTLPAAPTLAQNVAAFHAKHEQRYGYAAHRDPVEIVTVRIVAVGTTHKPPVVPAELSPAESAAAAKIGAREAWDGTRFVTTDVYERDRLAPGAGFTGPAIVEQYDSATYVAPGWRAQVDRFANLVLERVS